MTPARIRELIAYAFEQVARTDDRVEIRALIDKINDMQCYLETLEWNETRARLKQEG